jgi:alkylated DNA nucleotide flippase Atl1
VPRPSGKPNETPDARRGRVLSGIRAIPEGFVRSYGDIDPKAPRMVGHFLATTHDNVSPGTG